MLEGNEDVEILERNKLSPIAQVTSSEAGTKSKDKQEKRKECLDPNG
jgi:hypothetical protein